jgi:hypothetical protein
MIINVIVDPAVHIRASTVNQNLNLFNLREVEACPSESLLSIIIDVYLKVFCPSVLFPNSHKIKQ